ncbi:hypothetical protein CR513_19106, partial [Mucuna pruriens]
HYKLKVENHDHPNLTVWGRYRKGFASGILIVWLVQLMLELLATPQGYVTHIYLWTKNVKIPAFFANSSANDYYDSELKLEKNFIIRGMRRASIES